MNLNESLVTNPEFAIAFGLALTSFLSDIILILWVKKQRSLSLIFSWRSLLVMVLVGMVVFGSGYFYREHLLKTSEYHVQEKG